MAIGTRPSRICYAVVRSIQETSTLGNTNLRADQKSAPDHFTVASILKGSDLERFFRVA
jgi:hypothetical protein